VGARNMYRSEINIYEKELCVKLVIYKNYIEMHGQQNIKFNLTLNGLLSDLQESATESDESNQILQFLWLFIVGDTFLN